MRFGKRFPTFSTILNDYNIEGDAFTTLVNGKSFYYFVAHSPDEDQARFKVISSTKKIGGKEREIDGRVFWHLFNDRVNVSETKLKCIFWGEGQLEFDVAEFFYYNLYLMVRNKQFIMAIRT